MKKEIYTCDAYGLEISREQTDKTYKLSPMLKYRFCDECLGKLLQYAIKKTHLMVDCKEYKGTGKLRVPIDDGCMPGPYDRTEYKRVPCTKCQGWRA